MKTTDEYSRPPGLYKLSVKATIRFFDNSNGVLDAGALLIVESVSNPDNGYFYYRQYTVVSSYGCGTIELIKDSLELVS